MAMQPTDGLEGLGSAGMKPAKKMKRVKVDVGAMKKKVAAAPANTSAAPMKKPYVK